VESSLKAHHASLVFVLSQSIACASDPGVAAHNTQAAVLKKWALSRCLAKASGDSPAGDDAAKTAAAYLEMGGAGIEAYEKLDALAGRYLERRYTGSVRSNYNTMKCLDLYDSEELDRLARDSAK
jgi:Type VI secretion system (T6SS), amidase immunity protein